MKKNSNPKIGANQTTTETKTKMKTKTNKLPANQTTTETKTKSADCTVKYAFEFNANMEKLRIEQTEKHAAERLRSKAEVLRRKADRAVGETPEWVLTERKLALISERLIKADDKRKARGELTFAEHLRLFVTSCAKKAAWRLANPKTRSKRELDESSEIKSMEYLVVNSQSDNELGEITWEVSSNGATISSGPSHYEIFQSDIDEIEGIVWRWLQPFWGQLVAHFEIHGTFQYDKTCPERKFQMEKEELFSFWKNVFSEARVALEVSKGGRALRLKRLHHTVSLDAIESEAIRAMEDAKLAEYVFETEQILESKRDDLTANYDSLKMMQPAWVEHCEKKEAQRMERLEPDFLNAYTLAMRWIESADKHNPSRQKQERTERAIRCVQALYHSAPCACEPRWIDGKENPKATDFNKHLQRAKAFMLFGEGMEAIEEAKQVIARSPFRAARRAIRPLARVQDFVEKLLTIQYPTEDVLDEARTLVTKAQMLLDAVLTIEPRHTGNEIVDSVMVI
jgi:hypothetical protein